MRRSCFTPHGTLRNSTICRKFIPHIKYIKCFINTTFCSVRLLFRARWLSHEIVYPVPPWHQLQSALMDIPTARMDDLDDSPACAAEFTYSSLMNPGFQQLGATIDFR